MREIIQKPQMINNKNKNKKIAIKEKNVKKSKAEAIGQAVKTIKGMVFFALKERSIKGLLQCYFITSYALCSVFSWGILITRPGYTLYVLSWTTAYFVSEFSPKWCFIMYFSLCSLVGLAANLYFLAQVP